MTNPEPKCSVCGEGGSFERHGHPRREDFTPPTPGLASISDEKVLWLFDQLASAREEIARRRDELRSLDMRLTVERAARERAEARVKELEDVILHEFECNESFISGSFEDSARAILAARGESR